MNPSAPMPPPSPQAPPPAPSAASLRCAEGNRYIDRLTSAQQNQLFAWLSGTASIARIAQCCALPAPDGFGRPVSPTTLVRIRARIRAGRFTETLQEWDAQIEETEGGDAASLQRSQTIIITLLHKAALDLSQTDPNSPAFPKLVDAITKILHLDFRRQDLGVRQAWLEHARHDRARVPATGSTRHHTVDLNILPLAPHASGGTHLPPGAVNRAPAAHLGLSAPPQDSPSLAPSTPPPSPPVQPVG